MARTLSVVFCCLLLSCCLSARDSAKASTYQVSIRGVELSSGEVITNVEVKVRAGAFRAISNMPVGWYLGVQNDASWQTSVTANSLVGAASLSNEELKRLTFLIEKNEFIDLKFNISGAVYVTKDYANTRRIELKMSAFSLAPER
jgi:hypothetical protein